MMKFVFIIIPLLLFGQRIDSLNVELLNTVGSPIQGLKIGFSKIEIQTAIENLKFEPEFTYPGSEHFIIIKTDNGYDIQVNVRKLEKENEPGEYSALLMTIGHSDFVDYDLDLNMKPSRAYKIVVNPRNNIVTSDRLIELMSQVNANLEQEKYSEAASEINAARVIFGDHFEIESHQIYLLYLEGKLKGPELVLNIAEFDQNYPEFSLRPMFKKILTEELKSLVNQIKIVEKAESYERLRFLVERFLTISKPSYYGYDEVNEISDRLYVMDEVQRNGYVKKINVSFVVSPKNMQIFAQGNLADVERKDLDDETEQITLIYTEQIFNAYKRYPIRIAIIDPDGDYESMSYQDIDDDLNEWSFSYSSPADIQMSNKITLETIPLISPKWYYISAGAITAGILFNSSNSDPKKKRNKISFPANPKHSKRFLLNLGINF